MINHNFLPYEVCLLLPDINPYKTSLFVSTWVQDDKNGEYFIVPYLNFMSVRDAWTIIDALTWLENEKQKTIEVRPQYTRHKTTPVAWEVILNGEKKIEEKGTRINAYIAGIKQALELIK